MEENFFSLGANKPGDLSLAKRLNRALYYKICVADLIADPQTWPVHWIIMLFTAHKDRRTRYRLFVFLWKNGIPPNLAREWVMYHGINTRFQYDRSAWASLNDAVEATKTEEGRTMLKRTKCLDLSTGEVN